jgi:peptidoglycan-associated lipoprotein
MEVSAMLKKVVRMTGALVSVLSLMVLATGCKGSGDDVVLQPDLTTGNTTGNTGGVGDGLPEIDENTIFGPSGLQAIYFDYNSFSLRQDAIATLQRNADMIRAVPNVVVQIEGHCDDRGTQEYNLALGEKRALATREYLISLGIAADHIVTISYGEEMPAATGSGDSVWQQNRRCEFNKAM